MFGSDWPVLNLASDYQTWVNTAETLVSDLSDTERVALWGGTAAEFYGTA